MLITKRNKKYLEMTSKNFKKETDVEMYINILIELIENRENPEKRILLEGVLKYHMKYCTKPDSC